MLYLLFEMAANNDFDLDTELEIGNKRKQEKYLTKYLKAGVITDGVFDESTDGSA